MRVRALVIAVLFALAGLAGVAGADEPPRQREREVLRERPSGFWTSNRPAQGGAYRWRLLGLGVVIAGGMGIMIIRVLRTTNAPNDRR